MTDDDETPEELRELAAGLRKLASKVDEHARAVELRLRRDRTAPLGTGCVTSEELDELGTALALAEKSVDLDPRSSVAHSRLGWVLGSTGLAGTLLIVTMASAITFLTALSVAAIAPTVQTPVPLTYEPCVVVSDW